MHRGRTLCESVGGCRRQPITPDKRSPYGGGAPGTKFAGLAQLVEYLPCKQVVGGSSPSIWHQFRLLTGNPPRLMPGPPCCQAQHWHSAAVGVHSRPSPAPFQPLDRAPRRGLRPARVDPFSWRHFLTVSPPGWQVDDLRAPRLASTLTTPPPTGGTYTAKASSGGFTILGASDGQAVHNARAPAGAASAAGIGASVTH